MGRTEELKKQVGNRLRELRHAHDFTQDDVAEALEIATESYGRLERGISFPSIPTLIKVASLFDVATDDILGIVRANPPEPATEEVRVVRRLLNLVRNEDAVTIRRITDAVKLMVTSRRPKR